MPRRRPGALRAERGTFAGRRAPAWARELPPVDRLSPEASADVHRVRGRGHFYPLEDLLSRYRAFLERPGGRLRLTYALCPAPGCELDDLAVVRDGLAEWCADLPPEARSALARVLVGLDARLRRRTLPDPEAPRTDRAGTPRPWWHRLRYEDHQ
ncbi:hypothetical protein OOK31_14550 [Streptomyces sp. NBC_00249]|uniref:hypothetical protein n=1 Tax=Streptomyces sp. NBC_00249 TaxID=2975690 RepID=UPI00225B556B|nr:hypothetical protein [Streptomyces sp. NBC_00249]MCX5195106.1 hypothetical protein [Streptomyces sp. NBC_00249]